MCNDAGGDSGDLTTCRSLKGIVEDVGTRESRAESSQSGRGGAPLGLSTDYLAAGQDKSQHLPAKRCRHPIPLSCSMNQ